MDSVLGQIFCDEQEQQEESCILGVRISCNIVVTFVIDYIFGTFIIDYIFVTVIIDRIFPPDFAFRNCSSLGWLQENGLADR